MIRIDNGVIYFTPYGEKERELGKLADANVVNGYLIIGIDMFPLEHFKELEKAFADLYPNGKPTPVLPQTAPFVSDDQKAIDMMKYLMQSDEFLTAVGIPPKPTEEQNPPTA